MENSYKAVGNGLTDNGHIVARHSYHTSIKESLPWLEIRVFYVRVCKGELDDSTPEVLSLNHVPLDPGTLLEVNGVPASIYSDGVSTLLKRDRVDKKSEEVTFVSTDSTRMSGSVKFEVFDKDVLLLSGVLELCNNNGFVKESNDNGQRWSMKCESDIIPGTSFFKGKKFMLPDSALPTIEVYIAGVFLGSPIILTKILQLRSQIKTQGWERWIKCRSMKQVKKGKVLLQHSICRPRITCGTNLKMRITAVSTQEQYMLMMKMEKGNFLGSMLVSGWVLVLDSVLVLALGLELACLLKRTNAPLATSVDGSYNLLFCILSPKQSAFCPSPS